MLAAGFIISCLAMYFNIRHVAAKVGNDLEKKKFLWINCNIPVTNPSNGK
jgi:hypothetical protein